MNATYDIDLAVRTLGTICKQYKVSLSELTQAFPHRPTTPEEVNAIAEWLGQRAKADATTPAPSQDPYPGVAPKDKEGKAKSWRYALRDGEGNVSFYRVKRGRKPGIFFVDVQASDDLFPIRNSRTRHSILSTIAQDPRAALALYGQEIGECGRCGRVLTSEYRQLGIGPVCIDK